MLDSNMLRSGIRRGHGDSSSQVLPVNEEMARKTLKTFAFAVGLMLSTTIIADSKKESAQGIEALPRDVEMELASSALPAHLQEAATIYVLDPHKGFVVARKGTNSFHALVARTGDDAFRGS